MTLHIDGVDEELTLASVGSSRTKLSHGRILRCTDCSFAFRSFRPGEDELAQLYTNADATAYESELSYRTRTALTYRRIVSRHFPTPGCILDIGCASGFFLKAMSDVGWKVHGIEPSATQFQLAREALGPDARLLNTTLQRVDLKYRFDAITFWDVLEHTSEPVPFLAACASLLKPNGRVFFTVPNIDSWIARLMGSHWPLLLAEHVNHFNPESVRLCCERGGLHLEKLGLRAVNFSVDYVFYRLGQHGFKGMNSLRKGLSLAGMSRVSLPVYLGDMVCRARPSAGTTISSPGGQGDTLPHEDHGGPASFSKP